MIDEKYKIIEEHMTMDQFGETEIKQIVAANPLYPFSWDMVGDREVCYTVIGSSEDEGLLEDAWVMGYYLAKAGFVLQTMGHTELEKQFARGCKSVGGTLYHYPPDGQSAKVLDQSGFLDKISGVRLPKHAENDPFLRQWYTAMYILMTHSTPDFCFRAVDSRIYEYMVDEDRTHLFSLKNPTHVNALMHSITRMDAL